MSTATEKPPVPVIDKIHQRVYREASKPGALDMSVWHACDTTHCRAGWVVHLAGKAGRALQAYKAGGIAYLLANPDYRTAETALDIYTASSEIKIGDGTYESYPDMYFYDTLRQSLDDMKRCADEEAALIGFLGDDE